MFVALPGNRKSNVSMQGWRHEFEGGEDNGLEGQYSKKTKIEKNVGVHDTAPP